VNIMEEKVKHKLCGRKVDRDQVEVVKETEKMERSQREQVVGRGDLGRQINKEGGSWTTQQVEKSTGR
jgi:hypothetical protein